MYFDFLKNRVLFLVFTKNQSLYTEDNLDLSLSCQITSL